MSIVMDLLLHPLAAYVTVAAALVLSIGLFIQVKAEMRWQVKRWSEEKLALQTANVALRDALEELRKEAPPPPDPGPSPPAVRPSLNLTRRSQVLRLHHRGEGSEQIAAALGVPVNEVDLMLKINRMVNER